MKQFYLNEMHFARKCMKALLNKMTSMVKLKNRLLIFQKNYLLPLRSLCFFEKINVLTAKKEKNSAQKSTNTMKEGKVLCCCENSFFKNKIAVFHVHTRKTSQIKNCLSISLDETKKYFDYIY